LTAATGCQGRRFSKKGNAKKYNIIIFGQLNLIYRANIGKRTILCQNIGIIGHFQKDRVDMIKSST
jgi:hypothetical protein